MYQRLLRTAFYTSLMTYVLLLVLEYKSPGFVSFVFSPHLVLLLAVIFGTLYASTKPVVTRRQWYYVPALVIGLVLAAIVWREGTMFGEFRLLLSLGCLLLPVWTVSFVK
ncbi:TPA: hypothetical protein DEP96_00195 [Candidatus Uhrbacteria bacterium]|nr:hypothetical protein [Candidatus Uhrbacteria bacterium]